MPLSCSFAGSTRTWTCRLRCPQIDTLATPGTPVSRGTMVHCACTDISVSETDLELSPTFMMRFAVATGWSRVGGVDTFGSARACVIHPLTICRARMRSVPGLNNKSIEDKPDIHYESIDFSHSQPNSRSSSNRNVMNHS